MLILQTGLSLRLSPENLGATRYVVRSYGDRNNRMKDSYDTED